MQVARSNNTDLNFDVRNFVKKSRELQTAYVEFEGRNGKREMDCNDKNLLTKYISGAFYYKENSLEVQKMTKNEETTVKTLVEKLLSENKKFPSYTENKIFLEIIWLHSFNSTSKGVKYFPLIKLYKSRHENYCIFVSLNQHIYFNFASFLGSKELSPGLFCAPRNGFYTVDVPSGSLDLVFLLSKSDLSESSSSAVVPFTQTAILPWLEKIKNGEFPNALRDWVGSVDVEAALGLLIVVPVKLGEMMKKDGLKSLKNFQNVVDIHSLMLGGSESLLTHCATTITVPNNIPNIYCAKDVGICLKHIWDTVKKLVASVKERNWKQVLLEIWNLIVKSSPVICLLLKVFFPIDSLAAKIISAFFFPIALNCGIKMAEKIGQKEERIENVKALKGVKNEMVELLKKEIKETHTDDDKMFVVLEDTETEIKFIYTDIGSESALKLRLEKYLRDGIVIETDEATGKKYIRWYGIECGNYEVIVDKFFHGSIKKVNF